MTIADSTTLLHQPAIAAEPAWDVAKLFPNQGQWTEEDYFDLNTSRLVEYSCGNIEVLTMADDPHQAISAFLFELLLFFVRARGLGTVRFAPLPMKTTSVSYREPDVMFMKTENDARRTREYWIGADLVMEVVGTHDRGRDLDKKRREYAQAGIPEYWIVDPMLGEITVLTLSRERYEPAGVYKPGSQAASVLLPGFAVDVAAALAAK